MVTAPVSSALPEAGRLRADDRAFLTEFASYTCYTHPIAALALHQGAVDAERLATVAESLMRTIPERAAADRARTDRTAALVQSHVVTRLLAQLAAAIEDCGALGDAVRNRADDGVLHRYIDSRGGAVGTFWDLVLGRTPIHELLCLPEPSTLAINEPTATEVVASYAALDAALRDIAGIYRGRSTPGDWSSTAATGILDPDIVSIVTELIPTPPIGAAIPGATILDASNKIKHRFMLVERPERLGSVLAAQGEAAVLATYPRDPAKAERLVHNTVAVAQASGEMAALLLRLDEIGSVPPGL